MRSTGVWSHRVVVYTGHVRKHLDLAVAANMGKTDKWIILFITSKNVDSFKIDLTKATYVEEKFNEIEPRSILKKGDLFD